MKSLFWLTYIHVQVFLKSHTCMNCLFELFFTTHILNNNQTLSTNRMRVPVFVSNIWILYSLSFFIFIYLKWKSYHNFQFKWKTKTWNFITPIKNDNRIKTSFSKEDEICPGTHLSLFLEDLVITIQLGLHLRIGSTCEPLMRFKK